MAFERGHKFSKGRPKGVTNKRIQMLDEITDRLEVNPFETLLLFAKGDWQSLGYDSSVIVKESGDGNSTFLEYTISPELRAQCAKEACRYLYPTKKSIEHLTPTPFDGMSVEEKLAMMKQAVKVLEGELNAEPIEQAVITDGSKENP